MEFMFMVMVATLAVILFMAVFSEMYKDNLNDKRRIIAKDFGEYLQNEFLIASKADPGYYREFEIPEEIESLDMEIYSLDNTLVINYSQGVQYFQIPDHSGNLVIGTNNIRNINESICVNC